MAFTRKSFISASIASLTGLALSACGFEGNALTPLHEKIKPKALKKGDTLGLIAPGSPIYEESVFNRMLVDLKKLGFKLKLGKHVKKQRGYLAGTDTERAEDLMNMFENPEVDGIMCIRGGWGCNRILPLIDYELIQENPKVLCGYSDITSLHMAFYRKSNLITFHGPIGKSIWNDFTTQAFKKITWGGEQAKFHIPEEEDEASFTINPGNVRGKLMGGNLSVLTSMVGSDYLPSFKNSILFLEDIGESVYRIDRMLTQLKMAGILDEISGFVFGKCTECTSGSNSLTLKEVFKDHIKPLNIPAFYGAMISHEDNNITLPVGITSEIDATQKTIHVLEPAVV